MELHDVCSERGNSTDEYYHWLKDVIEQELLEKMQESLRVKKLKVSPEELSIYCYRKNNVWEEEISLLK